MSRVKSGNTKPELLVRSLVHRMGFRFRLHRRDLPGCPDVVLPRHRKVIFIHGCFWHGHEGCPRSARPSTNREFWEKKLSGNVERDKKNLLRLKELGWKTLVVWGCETKDTQRLTEILRHFLCE
jgi:DNA mismatch endonuclease, patch repair protein